MKHLVIYINAPNFSAGTCFKFQVLKALFVSGSFNFPLAARGRISLPILALKRVNLTLNQVEQG